MLPVKQTLVKPKRYILYSNILERLIYCLELATRYTRFDPALVTLSKS